MTIEALREQAEHAASVLAPETDLVADPDVAGLGRALASWLGSTVKPPVQLNPKDRRFADYMDQLVTGAGLEHGQEGKARLLTGLMVDALAPGNFLFTNPAALKCAFETGGASLVQGARNVVDDLLTNNGRPRQVDTSKPVARHVRGDHG